MAKVILDAGHGGTEPGASFNGRLEKDDTLRLTLAVGELLKERGIDVAYTRTEDVYNTPFEKAQTANQEGGDYFISFHRNSSPQPNQYSGAETLVYDRSGKKVELAEAVNEELEQVGFRNLGLAERPGLIVLRRTKMPAILIEAGFLNTDADNQLFDERFDEVAQAIANGITRVVSAEDIEFAQQDINTIWADDPMRGRMTASDEDGDPMRRRITESDEEDDLMRRGMTAPDDDPVNKERMSSGGDERFGCSCQESRKYYRVQTGAFQNRAYAEDLLYRLLQQNYPAYILREDSLYKVQVGAYRQLDNAVRMEQALRKQGYETFLTV